MSQKNQNQEVKSVKTSLTYEETVIKKIIGNTLESVDGLLDLSGGLFTDLKNKAINSDRFTDGVHVEVGTKEVAVDLDIVVEYQKDIPKLADDMKRLICQDIEKMTHLRVVEVNIKVVDIKTKEQHEADSVTLQDRLEKAAHQTGESLKETGAKLGEKAEEVQSDIEGTAKEMTEPRVK